jgi:peptidoglycan glycosyltransferase
VNRPIRNIAIACLVLFVALMLNVNYVQFVQADSLNAKNGNKRVINEEFSRDRGTILVDGKPVAESVKSKDEYKFQRRYPESNLYAPLTGYFSYVFGRGGIENSQNRVLSGSDNRLFVNRVVELVSNKQPKGGSVELTIDPRRPPPTGSRPSARGPRARSPRSTPRPERSSRWCRSRPTTPTSSRATTSPRCRSRGTT